MQQLNRVQPQAGPEHMKTFQIAAPVSTHWRPAKCAEVQCDGHVHGWQTIVPADSAAADYIRHDRTRSHREERQPGGLTAFTFGPGQDCFRQHQVRLDRPERFLVTGGDWRGNPRGERRVHASAADWQEDMAEHLDRIHTAIERG